LLARAAELGPPLYVGVSTIEFNDLKNKFSYQSYEMRCQNLLQLKSVAHVFPEDSWNQKAEDIQKYEAKYLVMGDDWTGQFDTLSKFTRVIYLPRTKDISSTLIRRGIDNNG
jgi:glycerol-3-phosphate cytidylyltransferase